MVQASCPNCDNTIRVKDELAGKKVKCPECGESIPIPAGNGKSSAIEPKSKKLASRRRQEDEDEDDREEDEEEEERPTRAKRASVRRHEDEDEEEYDEDEEEQRRPSRSNRASVRRRDDEEDEDEDDYDDEEPEKKSSGMLILICALVALLFLGAGGGVAAYFLFIKDKDDTPTAEAEGDKDKPKNPGGPGNPNNLPPGQKPEDQGGSPLPGNGRQAQDILIGQWTDNTVIWDFRKNGSVEVTGTAAPFKGSWKLMTDIILLVTPEPGRPNDPTYGNTWLIELGTNTLKMRTQLQLPNQGRKYLRVGTTGDPETNPGSGTTVAEKLLGTWTDQTATWNFATNIKLNIIRSADNKVFDGEYRLLGDVILITPFPASAPADPGYCNSWHFTIGKDSLRMWTIAEPESKARKLVRVGTTGDPETAGPGIGPLTGTGTEPSIGNAEATKKIVGRWTATGLGPVPVPIEFTAQGEFIIKKANATYGQNKFVIPSEGKLDITAFGGKKFQLDYRVNGDVLDLIVGPGVVLPGTGFDNLPAQGYTLSLRRDTSSPASADAWPKKKSPLTARGYGVLEQMQIKVTGAVAAVALSGDARVLAVGADPVVLYDVTIDPPREKARLGIGARSLAFSPDGRYLAVAGDDHALHVYIVAGNQPVEAPLDKPVTVNVVAFAPDGKTVATGAEDGVVVLWEIVADRVVQREVLKVADGSPPGIRSLVFSPDGKALATAGNGTLQLWDMVGKKPSGKAQILNTTSTEHPLAFTPASSVLLAGADKRLHVINLIDPTKAVDLPANKDVITGIGYTLDGKFVASASQDGQLVLLLAATGAPIHLKTGLGKIAGLAFPVAPAQLSVAPDQILALATQDRGVYLMHLGFTDDAPPPANDEVAAAAKLKRARDLYALAVKENGKGLAVLATRHIKEATTLCNQIINDYPTTQAAAGAAQLLPLLK